MSVLTGIGRVEQAIWGQAFFGAICELPQSLRNSDTGKGRGFIHYLSCPDRLHFLFVWCFTFGPPLGLKFRLLVLTTCSQVTFSDQNVVWCSKHRGLPQVVRLEGIK